MKRQKGERRGGAARVESKGQKRAAVWKKAKEKPGGAGAAAPKKAGGAGAAAPKKCGQMPPAFALRAGAFVARGVIAEGGVPLLVYRIALPAWEGQGRAQVRLSAFYTGVAAALIQGCEERLFPFVRRAYAESEDAHKKYRFARYTLDVDFSLDEQGTELLVRRQAQLLRRGRALYERAWEERFCKESGEVRAAVLARAAARVKPKTGLGQALKSAISRHTGPH